MLALVMALLLLPLSEGELLAQQAPPPPQYAQPQQDYSGQMQSDESGYPAQPVDAYPQPVNAQVVQPLDAVRLEQLVAPIALYPDSLVALVLTASTYPAQVVEADRWRQMQGYASPEQIAAGADAQNWDASVKGLTAFPQVLAQMDRNLPWTTDLGNAFYNQPGDILQAVQVMRQRAQAAGSLVSTPQVAVNYVSGNIQLVPVNPQIIYVPAYNPWYVYGQPVSPYPGFSLLDVLGSFLNSSVLHYGVGIAMTAFTHMPWGLLAWGLSWLVNAVLFHNSGYYSQSTTVADWGFPHGGPRAAGWAFGGGQSGYRGVGGGYRPGVGSALVHRPPDSYRYSGAGYQPARAESSVHRPPERGQAFAHGPANTYARSGGGYSAALGRSVPRPPGAYSGYRSAERSNRGYQSFGYARGAQQNRISSPVRGPSTDDRALSARLQRPSFRQSGSADFSGRSFARPSSKQPRVASFHSFGGGHGSQSFHAPKMKAPKAPKDFGGHSGGGHSGGHSGGKHHH